MLIAFKFIIFLKKSLPIKAVTSHILICIVDNGIMRGRSDSFNIGLICNVGYDFCFHQLIQDVATQDKGVFWFLNILNEILWNIEIWNLKLEIIDYIFRKIITLNEVNILESPNEYYQKQV